MHILTKEEQSIGGIKSGETRRKKAIMRKELELMLEEKNKKGIAYKTLTTLGLIKGACNGKAENYKLICQLLGELEIQEERETPQVNINIVDNSELEKAMYESKD